MPAFPFEVRMPSRLNPEDQQRVDQYLSAPQHQVERRPFRPWLLLVLVLVVVLGLGLLSRLLSRLVL
jgi:cytoskeletal protein RodZ